jgi:hypothetical protein
LHIMIDLNDIILPFSLRGNTQILALQFVDNNWEKVTVQEVTIVKRYSRVT